MHAKTLYSATMMSLIENVSEATVKIGQSAMAPVAPPDVGIPTGIQSSSSLPDNRMSTLSDKLQETKLHLQEKVAHFTERFQNLTTLHKTGAIICPVTIITVIILLIRSDVV